jgi:DNA-binding response OmpR family regulator
VQIASTYDEALRCVEEEEFDIAILDVNLNGKLSFPLGDVLRRRHRPFVFATGYNLGRSNDGGVNAIYVTKPYDQDRLKAALMQALDNSG